MRNRTWPTSTTAPSWYSRFSSTPLTWARMSTTRKPATRPEKSRGRGTSAAVTWTTPTCGAGGAVAAGAGLGRLHQNAAAPAIATTMATATTRAIQRRAIIDSCPSQTFSRGPLAGHAITSRPANARGKSPHGALRAQDIHTLCRQDGRGGQTLSTVRLSGAAEGRPRQAPCWLFPGRHRDHQPARPPLEVRRRRRSAGALGGGVRQHRLHRGLRCQVPAPGDDAGGEAAAGRAVGAASLGSLPGARHSVARLLLFGPLARRLLSGPGPVMQRSVRWTSAYSFRSETTAG